MVRLRAWVESFALTMAVTDANRHTAGQSQVEKDTTKLIGGVVSPAIGELTRPMDDKMKAERRKLGKSTVAGAELAGPSGITAKQLAHGREQLNVTEGPRPAAPATSAHGVTAAELADRGEHLTETDGPRPAAPATTAHGVTLADLFQGHEQLKATQAAAPPAAHLVEEVTDAQELADQLAHNLATYGGQVPAALRTRSQAVLTAYRARIAQVQATLANDQATREQRQRAAVQLRVMHDRADDANADLVEAVLNALPVPNHTPVLAASHAEPAEAEAEAEDRGRHAEPMLS
jgi:hypothetical protein